MANLSLYNSHSQADNIFSMNICSSIWSVLFHAQFLILQWLCSRECADRFHNALFFFLSSYICSNQISISVGFFLFLFHFFPSCSASCQILDSVLMFCSVSPRFISFSIWRQFMQTSCRGKNRAPLSTEIIWRSLPWHCCRSLWLYILFSFLSF